MRTAGRRRMPGRRPLVGATDGRGNCGAELSGTASMPMQRSVSERLRPAVLPAALAVAGLAALAWLGLYGFAWNDYDDEARLAVDALLRGDLRAFAALSPAYGGSLLLRAPFALAASALGGGDLAVYRALALPCLAAAGVIAVLVASRMRLAGKPALAWLTAIALIAANPIELRALELGHPEELLVGALCVGAALAAIARRPTLAAVLVGLAVAAKPWAVLAVPAVVALAEDRRVRTLVVAGAVAAAVMAPVAALNHDRFIQSNQAVAQTSQIFQPWQAWWFAGRHGEVVRGLDGQVKPGYRAAPKWLSGLSRPLVVLAAIALTVLWWRRSSDRRLDALLLLALAFLVRCLLDPWDNVYYAVPLLLCLTAWEGLARREPPVVSLGTTALLWVTFEELPELASADLQSLAYLAWSVPLAAWLALRALAPQALVRASSAVARLYSSREAAPIRGA